MSIHLKQTKSIQQHSSDSVITPQEIYQTLIRQTPNLYPLCKFKSKASNRQIFPDAVKYPDFFNYNLVSPGRVIKRVQGNESLLRGFYYQLMKLAFEIQVEERDYIEVLKNVLFSPELMLEQNPSSPSSGKSYSDLQYKKIIAEFMQILIHQSIPNFELSIMNYPIVDEAMLKVLENLLRFKCSLDFHSNQSQMPSLEILHLLCDIFQVTVIDYGNCYKFEESDIFLYEHSKKQFYIAFLNQMAEMSDMSQSRRDSSYQPSSSKKIIQVNDHQRYDSAEKKQKIITEQVNSQFDIQTPVKDPSRHSATNLTDANVSDEKKQKEDKNYRHTFGFYDVKSLQSIVSNDTQQNLTNTQDSKTPMKDVKGHQRQGSELMLSELHTLVYETHDDHNKNLVQQNQKSVHMMHIPNVQMARSVGQPDSSHNTQQMARVKSTELFNYDKSSMNSNTKYEYQPKGYGRKVTFDQTLKAMTVSAQSDEVIGYSLNDNKVNSNIQESKKFDFMNSNQQKKYQINPSRAINPNPSQFSSLHNYTNNPTEKKQSMITKEDFSKWNKQVSTLNSTNFTTQKFTSKLSTEEDIFYSPKSILPKPSIFPQSTFGQSKPAKNQQSLGTLYKQFTDTKVLDILPEDVQYNIRRMRRKYKGVHSKDFFGYQRF